MFIYEPTETKDIKSNITEAKVLELILSSLKELTESEKYKMKNNKTRIDLYRKLGAEE